MVEPKPPSSSRDKERKRLKNSYFLKKHEYLYLCSRYDLSPRDLSLEQICSGLIGPSDRHKLIKLVVVLRDMEEIMEPGQVGDMLFAKDDSRFNSNEIFMMECH